MLTFLTAISLLSGFGTETSPTRSDPVTVAGSSEGTAGRDESNQQPPLEQIEKLLNEWSQRPAADETSDQYAKPIRALTKQLYQPLSPLTESHRQASEKLATICWPYVLKEIPKPMAEIIVDLTEPSFGVRMLDRLGKLGQPTEPMGWDIQSTHALALARAGRTSKALRENEALSAKIQTNVMKGRLPELQLTFLNTMRSQRSLLMQSMLQQAVIHAVAGDNRKSFEAAALAGGVDVTNPTEADLQVGQRLLTTLVRAQLLGLPAFENGFDDVTFLSREDTAKGATFRLQTGLSEKHFTRNLKTFLGADWQTSKLQTDDMYRAVQLGRSIDATVELTLYRSDQLTGFELHVFYLTHKAESTLPNVQITVRRTESIQ